MDGALSAESERTGLGLLQIQGEDNDIKATEIFLETVGQKLCPIILIKGEWDNNKFDRNQKILQRTTRPVE